MQLKQSVLSHWIVGTLLIASPRFSHFIQKIILSIASTISVNHYFTSSNFLWRELWLFQTILLLLKLSFTLAFTSPFSCPRLPYLDYAAGWLSQLFCMQVALAWFFVEERERGSEIVPRILRKNYSFSWRWGVEKTRLPCSINCCLRETDILGGQQFWKCDQPF